MRLPLVDTHAREMIERCLAALRRLLDPREVFEMQPTDAVWPVLRGYPYGPPTR